ncbi:integrase/recombinase [Adoxophyes honmai entomopoxvirus 'L' virophage 2]|nr:integrase/recombinase [Adoxophyes honmai entomopoxvirus 'L' virophage 2]
MDEYNIDFFIKRDKTEKEYKKYLNIKRIDDMIMANDIKTVDEYIKYNTRVRSPKSLRMYKYWLNHLFKYYSITFDDKLSVDEFKNIKFNITEKDYNDIIKHNGKKVYNRELWLNQVPKLFPKSNFNKPINSKDIGYKLKTENVELHYIPKEHLELLYDKANDKDKLIMLILLTTGMRIGGFCNIRSENIDLNKNTIKTIEKGNNLVTFKITMQIIKDLIISTKYFDKPLKDKAIYYRIKQLCKKCNIIDHKHIHPHSFRHTYARLLINDENNLDIVQKSLGHKDSKITNSFYLKEKIVDVVDRCKSKWKDIDTIKEDVVPYFLKNKNIII